MTRWKDPREMFKCTECGRWEYKDEDCKHCVEKHENDTAPPLSAQ